MIITQSCSSGATQAVVNDDRFEIFGWALSLIKVKHEARLFKWKHTWEK